MKLIKLFCLFLYVLFLSACTSVKESTAVQHNGFEQEISLSHQLPKALPGGSTPIPGISYIFVLPESPAGWLVPVPFLDDLVVKEIRQNTSNAYKNKFIAADPYEYAVQSLRKNSFCS